LDNKIPQLEAASYIRQMRSGRTKPCIFACEDDVGNPAGEYVVKMRGGMESGDSGLFCELLAALLAQHFELTVSDPAIIHVDSRLAELIADPMVAELLRKSAGLNFGSRLLTGIYIWPQDRQIPFELQTMAAEIFAFDALIQNPDRRFSNPNLLADNEHLFPIDHECAFGCRYAIPPAKEPWRLDGIDSDYLREHVFFRQLKGKSIDMGHFKTKLIGLNPDIIKLIVAQIPQQWQGDFVEKMETHLSKINERAQDFIDQVKVRLA
jgi:hypothetical protein